MLTPLRAFSLAAFICAFAAPAQADSWANPQVREVFSASRDHFILEPEDKLGIYTLKANVTDHVAGTTLKVQQAITAADSK